MSLPKIDAYVGEVRKALADNAQLPQQIELPTYPISNPRPRRLALPLQRHDPSPCQLRDQGRHSVPGRVQRGRRRFLLPEEAGMIGGWRTAWNQGDFPFYFVQLANFQNPNNNPGAAMAGGRSAWPS